jgi:hypothetical protein
VSLNSGGVQQIEMIRASLGDDGFRRVAWSQQPFIEIAQLQLA